MVWVELVEGFRVELTLVELVRSDGGVHVEGGGRGERRVRASCEEVGVAGERKVGEYQQTRFGRRKKVGIRNEEILSKTNHVQKVEVCRRRVKSRSERKTTRLKSKGQRTNEEEAFDR